MEVGGQGQAVGMTVGMTKGHVTVWVCRGEFSSPEAVKLVRRRQLHPRFAAFLDSNFLGWRSSRR